MDVKNVCVIQFDVSFDIISVILVPTCSSYNAIILKCISQELDMPSHILQLTAGNLAIFPWSNLLMLSTKHGSTKYHF